MNSIIIMIFGALGCVFAVTFFALEYGKWKRKAIAIDLSQKIIRSFSFLLMLCAFGGIFLFGLFGFMGYKKTALVDFLITLLLIIFLLINLFVDFALTRKKKCFITDRDIPRL